MTKSQLIVGALVFVSFSMMASMATMNVGTFWFAQNNGKFFPLKPYNNLLFRGGPRRQIQQQQIPTQFNSNNNQVDPVQAKVRPTGSRLLPQSWWTDFQVWNKMMRYLHHHTCKLYFYFNTTFQILNNCILFSGFFCKKKSVEK